MNSMPLNLDKLKAMRFKMEWTQEVAAKRCKLGTKARWNDIETGRRSNITISTLDDIAKAFGVSPRDLIK